MRNLEFLGLFRILGNFLKVVYVHYIYPSTTRSTSSPHPTSTKPGAKRFVDQVRSMSCKGSIDSSTPPASGTSKLPGKVFAKVWSPTIPVEVPAEVITKGPATPTHAPSKIAGTN